MFFQRELAILMLALILDSQVYAANIIGGHEVLPHSRPYMVLLKMHMEGGKEQHCGGFLLNEDYVMTAAHCQAENYTVLLGLHNIRRSEEVQHRHVEKKIPHYNYQQDKLKNDIMLLKLKSKAHFNDKVGPISLAGQEDFLPKSCTVSGWGRSNRNSNLMTLVLMEADVTLIESEECPGKRLYCSEGEAGPGRGDSGGPLVCEDGRAYGVVAAARIRESNRTDIPTHFTYCYTMIPQYREWIDNIMEDGNYV
ncbi:granzyme G-like [Echeneis naucrates]|uniref:trypsin n=1 Tax=Echeneis naucrates TaxID=173247 RepID=A0A665TCF3_ECHNA|nr:granzyme G-like [Echeneis naucrates]